MELGTLSVGIKMDAASSTSNHETTTGGLEHALAAMADATTNAAEATARLNELSRGFSDFYFPPEPVEVELILPHKKHLVPKHQEAKRREQLRVWGLRK